MERQVMKGKVIEEKRYAVEIQGEKFYVPKGCDPFINPQLGSVAGRDVEVLFAGTEILAIRVDKQTASELKIKPIITCYLMPPFIVFDQVIMEKIQPIITKSLVESGVLDKDIAKKLEMWQKEI